MSSPGSAKRDRRLRGHRPGLIAVQPMWRFEVALCTVSDNGFTAMISAGESALPVAKDLVDWMSAEAGTGDADAGRDQH